MRGDAVADPILLRRASRPLSAGISDIDAQLDPRAFIAANLPLVAVPGLPEIVLHRAQASSGLGRLAAADPQRFGSPYWAYAWPGGLALAHFLRDHPEMVAGRRVLDLGAGTGLVAIAAARAGAAKVIAAETDPYARVALGLNAAANNVDIAHVADDLTTGPAPEVDIVLVGDLFYAQDLATRVTAFLGRCRAAGCDVLVGDLGRPFLPREKLQALAAYPVTEVGTASASMTGEVFRFLVPGP